MSFIIIRFVGVYPIGVSNPRVQDILGFGQKVDMFGFLRMCADWRCGVRFRAQGVLSVRLPVVFL